MTSSLRSPHTIQIYDFGVTDDGAFYYVMELLDGFDLQVLVERFGPVPVDRAVHLLLQVCDSLSEAHDRGLIHRDIKPANVYACRYGRDVDFVKVLDFGLVKPISTEQSGTELALTGVHAAHGTPGFMAPEQALGTGTRGPPRRPVRARLPGLLAGHGQTGLRGQQPDRHDREARQRAARAAVAARRRRSPARVRRARARLSREGPGPASGERRRSGGAAAPPGKVPRLDDRERRARGGRPQAAQGKHGCSCSDSSRRSPSAAGALS